MKFSLIDHIKRLKAIADTGLLYSSNDFEKERYEEIQSLLFDMLTLITDRPVEALKVSFPTPADYPTVKVDIRGILINEKNQILLVRERDGKWSLPGGWADIGFTPKEVIIKEFEEETGIHVTVDRLLAVFDKRQHPHPPQPFYVYKLVFLCSTSAEPLHFKAGFDVLDTNFFDLHDLPELSTDRILPAQVHLLSERIKLNYLETYFD